MGIARLCPKILYLTISALIVKHYGARADRRLRGPVLSRLRKGINRQRKAAYTKASKRAKEYSIDYGAHKKEPSGRNRNLPYPRKLLPTTPHHGGQINIPKTTGWGSIIVSSKPSRSTWQMMEKHRLWVRVFDKDGRLLFNHTNPQCMHTSQIIHLCTKLVNHLNLISQTNELEVQKALGTFEETVIAQLTPPLNGSAPFHEWNLQEYECNDVGAITIINQTEDGVFKGQIIDDFTGTFELQ